MDLCHLAWMVLARSFSSRMRKRSSAGKSISWRLKTQCRVPENELRTGVLLSPVWLERLCGVKTGDSPVLETPAIKKKKRKELHTEL